MKTHSLSNSSLLPQAVLLSLLFGIGACRAQTPSTTSANPIAGANIVARADLPNGSYELQVRRTRFAGQPLDWVGATPPSEAESRSLWQALGEGQGKKRPDIAASLEGFVKTHPRSPWRPGIEDRLGVYYRDAGYFSLALSHWESGWNAAGELKDINGAREADQALLDWLRLLASLGQTDQMKRLFDQAQNRAMPRPARDALNRVKMAYRHMLI